MTKYELRFTKNNLTATLPMEIVDKILGYISHPITQYLKEHEELANDKEKEKIDYWLGTPKFKIEHALYMQHFKKSTDGMYVFRVYFKKQPKNVDCITCRSVDCITCRRFKVCDNVGFVNVDWDGIEEFYPIESLWGKKIIDTDVAKWENPFLRVYENVSRLQEYIDMDNIIGGFQYKSRFRRRGITRGIVDGWIFGTDIEDMRYNIKRELLIVKCIKGVGSIQELNRYGRHRLYHVWRHIQDGEVPPYNPRKHKNPNIIKKKK